MAFTTAEATSIRHALGYPQLWRYQNPRLESAIETVGGDADALALVQGLLTSIATVRAQISGVALVSAGVKALDRGDVELYQGEQIKGMRGIGRGYCAELSHLFGVPIVNDIFGERGYQGDEWKGQNGISRLAGLG